MQNASLCLAPTDNGPCWRKPGHHGKHVRQYQSLSAPIVAISEDGVAKGAASPALAHLVDAYAKASGCYVVDLRDPRLKS
jgi:hypothetical protein